MQIIITNSNLQTLLIHFIQFGYPKLKLHSDSCVSLTTTISRGIDEITVGWGVIVRAACTGGVVNT